jgi:dGTPase
MQGEVTLLDNSMKWEQLLSNKRFGQEKTPHREDDRSEFQRDFDRLIFSAPFRRLQNKTQVFPLPGSIFVHNRLTHSLEVSSVGRSLGNDVSRLLLERHPRLAKTHLTEMGSIVSAACLAHDLGNPPFGHSGERAIGSYFSEEKGRKYETYFCDETGDSLTPEQWQDLVHFEGNANAFRLLTHHFRGRREGGFVMTYSTLASIVKYPYSSSQASKKGKFGFFQAEQADFNKIAQELGIKKLKNAKGGERYARYPLVYLVEAADDICYQIMDIEDAHKLKILTTEETHQLLMGFFDKEKQKEIRGRLAKLDDINEQVVYLRSIVISLLESECVRVFVDNEKAILDGRFEGSLIDHISERASQAYKTCVKTAVSKIYRAQMVVDIEIAGHKVITQLLDLMLEAVTHSDRTYSMILINRVSSQYQIDAPTLYERILAVLDYISGMTDVFALDLYRKINGMSLATV